MESYYDGSVPFMVCTQQICVPHPKYPSTRVAIRLPSLGFQFSPARYHRLMQVINVFSSQSSKGGEDSATSSIRPWDPADFEGPLSVLSWKVLKQTPCLMSVCLSVFPKLAPAAHFAQKKEVYFAERKIFFGVGHLIKMKEGRF
jgi:hypothetical protein